MAARRAKAQTKKTVTRKAVTRKVETEKSENTWWNQYTYTPWELTSKVLLFAILAFAFLRYRGLLIAASVNGRPISRVSVISELESEGGQRILDNLVNQELIRQKAQEAHVEVTQEEVDAKLAEIEASVAQSGQTLDSVLALQGMNREMLVDQIKTRVTVEKLLQGDINVTDEDITKYMTDYKDTLPKDMPEAELRDLVKNDIFQGKLSERYATWIQELKDESTVNYYTNY